MFFLQFWIHNKWTISHLRYDRCIEFAEWPQIKNQDILSALPYYVQDYCKRWMVVPWSINRLYLTREIKSGYIVAFIRMSRRLQRYHVDSVFFVLFFLRYEWLYTVTFFQYSNFYFFLYIISLYSWHFWPVKLIMLTLLAFASLSIVKWL